MQKQQFKCRTEDESFSFIANPSHLNQVAATILTQHGVRFVEISDMDNNVLMIVSHNPERTPDKAYAFALSEARKTEK